MILTTILLMLLALQSCFAQQFTVQPESVVQAEGLEAVFKCQFPGATSHSWKINGQFLKDNQFPPNVTRILPSVDSPPGLIIIAIPQYNNTVVQCRAIIDEGEVTISELSENAMIEVQGPLHSVANLRFLIEQSSSTTITISWEAPSSLNLTTAEPDIQYCVDVYNVTRGGDDHLQSVCDIIDTHYTFTASDPDQLFNFTVTPRSNVKGSLNGTTSQPEQGYLILEPTRISAQKIDLAIVSSLDFIAFDVAFPSEVRGSLGSFPTEYFIELTNYDTSGVQVTCSATPSSSADMIVLAGDCTRSVTKHRLFNVTVITINSAGESRSDPVLLSTHDVQRVNTFIVSEQQLDVTCSFLNGSTDPGCFVIVWSESEIIYGVASRNDTESNTTVSLKNVQSCEDAMTVVFDLQYTDSMTKPEMKLAKTQSVFIGTANNTGSSFLPSPSLLLLETNITDSNDGEICMSCLFSAPELTGCVGVIHSAQLVSNLTLTALIVERSGGKDCTNVNTGNYSIAIFGMLSRGLVESPAYQRIIEVNTKDVSEPLPDNVSTSTAAQVSSIVVALTVIGIVIVLFIVLRQKKKIKKKCINSAHNYQEDTLPENHYSVMLSDSQGGPPPVVETIHSMEAETPFVEPQNDSLLENFYCGAPLDTQGDPPSPFCIIPTSDQEYKNVNLKAKTANLEAPPSYEVATTHFVEQSGNSESMVQLMKDKQSTTKMCYTLPEIILHGGKSSSSIASVEEPPEQVASTLSVKPSCSGMTSEVQAYSFTCSQENSHSPLNSSVTQEPAWALAKQILVKEATTSSDPPPDSTQTEHQYCEISGTVSQESGGHYAPINFKSDRNYKPSMDPTKVLYASIDNLKLIPASSSEDIQKLIEGNPAPPPLPPSFPTPETVLSELHPIAVKWKELGLALGVPEHILDNIFMEGSDQVRLHEMVQYYLQFPHSWEEIVRALREIGETEPADKIVRTKKLEMSLPTTPQTPPLPLPPKKHQHNAQSCDHKAKELSEFKINV